MPSYDHDRCSSLHAKRDLKFIPSETGKTGRPCKAEIAKPTKKIFKIRHLPTGRIFNSWNDVVKNTDLTWYKLQNKEYSKIIRLEYQEITG